MVAPRNSKEHTHNYLDVKMALSTESICESLPLAPKLSPSQ